MKAHYFSGNLQRHLSKSPKRKKLGYLRRPVFQLIENIYFKLWFLGVFLYICFKLWFLGILTQIKPNQMFEGIEKVDMRREGWENWNCLQTVSNGPQPAWQLY